MIKKKDGTILSSPSMMRTDAVIRQPEIFKKASCQFGSPLVGGGLIDTLVHADFDRDANGISRACVVSLLIDRQMLDSNLVINGEMP
jgi:hypothetical protein